MLLEQDPGRAGSEERLPASTARGEAVFLALRHRWRDDAFLNLEIERFVTPAEFDAITAARCR